MFRITLLLLLAAIPVTLQAQAQPTPGTFIVHEWGTFLSVQGSDGKTIGGMVESDEPLPGFVISRSLDGFNRSVARRGVFSKMETPVTYFYTDRSRYVSFEAKMPQGLLTHWYPSISSMTPDFKKGESLKPEQGSSINFGRFLVQPESSFVKDYKRTPLLPKVPANDPWLSMRQPDSAIVSFATGNSTPREEEKFLFYRGLGAFQLPLEAKSSGQDEALSLHFKNDAKQPLAGMFLIEVRDQKIRYAELSPMNSEGQYTVMPETILSTPLPLDAGIPLAKQAVARALVQTGLYPKEAHGMVDHWQRSYFSTPGLRVLYMLPRDLTDAYIPITVNPKPQELVRTMVGRLELFTPYSEALLLRCMEQLNEGTMTRAEFDAKLAHYGRFREAVLRRVMTMQASTAIKTLAEKLLSELTVVTIKSDDAPATHVNCSNFLMKSVSMGLKADAVPPQLAKEWGNRDESFLQKCTICMFVKKAMQEYAQEKSVDKPCQLSVEWLAQLKSENVVTREDALRRLVERYITMGLKTIPMTAEAKVQLKKDLDEARKEAILIMKSGGGQKPYCPSCDGACQIPHK